MSWRLWPGAYLFPVRVSALRSAALRSCLLLLVAVSVNGDTVPSFSVLPFFLCVRESMQREGLMQDASNLDSFFQNNSLAR